MNRKSDGNRKTGGAENPEMQEKKTGSLYGIGTGPGDPELMTVKAIRLLGEADVIAVPEADPNESMAYKTAVAACPEISEKDLLPVPFLMKNNPAEREAARQENAAKIAAYLDHGADVAFITIGDPAVYTTFGYVFNILKSRGYSCVIINGVPSFCAAAARLGRMLVMGDEKLEVIPGGAYPGGGSSADDDEGYSDTTQVYMKFKSNFYGLMDDLKARGEQPAVIENCCLPGERTFSGADSLPDDIGYFNIVISRRSEGK